MGHSLDEVELDKAFTRFKELADRKKVIVDADLEALIADEFYRPLDVYILDGMQVTCGTFGMPTATVRLKGPDGKVHVQASMGSGPVDAAYKAIDPIIKAENTLLEFNIHAITEGIDALGEVTVRIQSKSDDMKTMDAQKEIPHHTSLWWSWRGYRYHRCQRESLPQCSQQIDHRANRRTCSQFMRIIAME